MKLFLLKKLFLRNKLWQWHSSKQTKTLYLKSHDATDGQVPPASCSTNSSEYQTFSDQYENTDDELSEVNLNSLQTEKLFFNLDNTRSILCEEKRVGSLFKESVMLAIDSYDPYMDFRRSMEEMVDGHGLKDWECLEELLEWYLRVNEKINHGFIIGAYVDLLVKMVSSSSLSNDSTDSTFSSPLSL